MNSRIREIAPGLIAERIAEQTHVAYEPIGGGAEITFVASEYLLDVDAAAIERLGSNPDILRAKLDDIAGRRFGEGAVDPVTSAPLDDVSAAGVAVLLKRAYHILHNERAAAQAAQAAGGE